MTRPRITPATVAVAGTTGICAAAAWLSFTALTDLAARSGITTPWAWPLIVDGLIVVATVAVVARAGRYAWALLIAGMLLSVAGNVLHTAIPDSSLPTWLRATVAAVPPVALVAVAHLAVVLRRATPATHEVPDECDTATPAVAPEAPRAERSDTDTTGPVAPDTTPRDTPPAKSARHEVVDVLSMPPDEAAATPRARAIQLLTQGTPPRDVAAQLGVHRTTVYRWQTQHAGATP